MFHRVSGFVMMAAGLAGVGLASQQVRAEILTYYVGLDQHVTLNSYQDADNSYVGLPNPNYNRLTFLYAHPIAAPIQASHYHGRSIYFYTGPASSPTVVDTTADNVFPEAYTGFPPLGLRLATTGDYAGKLTSYAYADRSDTSEGHYSDLTVTSTSYLLAVTDPTKAEYWLGRDNKGTNPDGTAGTVGKYSKPLTGVELGFKLVDATPGLHLGIGSDLDVGVGNVADVGAGTTFRFTPTYWVDATAPVGTYTATLQLVDLNAGATGVLPSGLVRFEFTNAVPEPSAAAILAMPVLGWIRRRR